MVFSADSPILSNSIQVRPSSAAASCLRASMANTMRIDLMNAIVPAYFSVCASVGMEPVMSLAQMIHETGCLTSWWSQRPRRNPAGIGVTGRTGLDQPPAGASGASRWHLGRGRLVS